MGRAPGARRRALPVGRAKRATDAAARTRPAPRGADEGLWGLLGPGRPPGRRGCGTRGHCACSHPVCWEGFGVGCPRATRAPKRGSPQLLERRQGRPRQHTRHSRGPRPGGTGTGPSGLCREAVARSPPAHRWPSGAGNAGAQVPKATQGVPRVLSKGHLEPVQLTVTWEAPSWDESPPSTGWASGVGRARRGQS